MRSTINPTLLLIFLFFSSSLTAQISSAGGGAVDIPTSECISPEQSAIIVEQLKENIDQLIEAGVIKKVDPSARAVTKFAWPLRQADGASYFDYYATINFVDLDASGNIEDYNCNDRSYDGHNGIDYSLWPYWWKMMEEDQVEVIAGAPGTIISKQDGNFDMNCSCIGTWNAVYIRHDDGSVAWYGHLKTNTLLNKAVGEKVVEGEYLGVVGSSGCSSNPHLHFEIRDQNMNVIEPYKGGCNQTVSESWWQDQKDYVEPGLNLLMTHDIQPSYSGFCPVDEKPNFKTNFDLNSRIYFAAYYHDHLAQEATEYKILTPDGTVFQQWMHASPESYASSWWYWSFDFSANLPQGEWTFQAKFLNETFEHKFTFGNAISSTNLIAKTALEMFPNPTASIVNISNLESPSLRYNLRTINSKIVQTGSLSSTLDQIDVSALDNGLYFIEILDDTDKLIHREKLIKMNP